MTEELDANLKEEPVTIRQNGSAKTFIIQELIGGNRDEYLQSQRSRGTFEKDGETYIQDIRGMKADLLKNSLVELMADGTRRAITAEEVQALPFRVVDKLWEKSRKINALNDEAEEEAKND